MTGKRITICCNLWLIAFLVSIMIPGCDGFSCKNGTMVVVPAGPEDWRVDVLTATSIEIKRGNTISFSASGIWSVGLGSIGPDGKEDWVENVKGDCVEYPVGERSLRQRNGRFFRGYVGALIGRIGLQGKPFLIGSRKTITAPESGKLFLGSNDNLCPCPFFGGERGSCYEDNRGFIKVCVQITN